MKLNYLLLAIACTLFASACTKIDQKPLTNDEKKEQFSKANRIVNQSEYCYRTTQTSSDSWSIKVYQISQDPGTVGLATFAYKYDVHDNVTNTNTTYGWTTFSTFPVTLPHGIGNAGYTFNIQIRERVFITSPWGPQPVDYIYNVNQCP